jgi:alpha 1,3-glucosidase
VWASQYVDGVLYKHNKEFHAWNDMNEPSVFDRPELTFPKEALHYSDNGNAVENREVHNIYGALMQQATYFGLLLRNQPDFNHRPFLLSRSFFAGSQKYGAVWTGDNRASEEHMLMSIPMLLQMSISGLGFVGTDIGGFYPSADLFETD